MKKQSILILAVIILLSSCAINHHIVIDTELHVCGFWSGLWHGIIAPIAFVVSLFNDNVTVWDVNNNGGWYTFGFLIGIGTLSGCSTYKSK